MNKEVTSKKVYLRSFGCQMNERDSEFIVGLFLEKGYELTESPDMADIILFNTCSVRAHAEERAIKNMAQLMHRHKDRIYGMAGCAAQALKDKLFDMLPALNIVCGTGEIARLPELVEKIHEIHYEGPSYAKASEGKRGTLVHRSQTRKQFGEGGTDEARKKRKVVATDNINGYIPEIKTSYRKSDKHAYVSIMRGCNNFCSYCIVPHVRGKERSRKAQDILSEVKGLADGGIKNITLLGQNVNSYRGTYSFVKLLDLINGINGIERITFMTSHPKDATPELFKAMRDLEKIVKHLHLPLQSGSGRILKLMNRGYTRKKYLGLVKKARKIIPGLRLTTDVIVGFPSETEKDFRNTLDLMKKVRFDGAYIFKYSPRAGTRASRMKPDVPEEAKKRRHGILLDLQRKLSKRKKDAKTCHSCAV